MPRQLKKIFFLVTLFLAGASVLIIEIQGARLLAPQWGSTVYVWSSLITVAMAALSLGYVVGGKLVDRRPRLCLLYMVVIAAGLTLFIEVLTYLLFGNQFIPLGIVWGPLVVVTLVFGLPLMCLAMVTPIALRLQAKEILTLGNTAGRLYALATIGSLVGSLLSGFVLSAYIPVLQVFFFLSITLTAWGGVGILFASEEKAGKKTLAVLLGASLIVFGGGWYFLQNLKSSDVETIATNPISSEQQSEGEYAPTQEAKQIPELDGPTEVKDNGMPLFPTLFTSRGTLDANVILHEPSFYGDVMVFDFAESIRCFMIDGANESCWNFDRNLPSEYTHDIAYTLMNSEREVKDVLVVGSGAGTLAKFLRSEGHENVEIDGVEINPVMIEVAEKYFSMPKDDHARVTLDDGRHFLATTDKKYDAIILDICYVSSANVHLWTEEFFALAKSHLKDPDNGLILASRGISNDSDSDKMDDMVANALARHFTNIYSIERIDRSLPNDFGMGVFVASEKPLQLTETGGNLGVVAIQPWQFDASVGVSTDAGHGELLQLSAGATQGIREQTAANFGSRLLQPL